MFDCCCLPAGALRSSHNVPSKHVKAGGLGRAQFIMFKKGRIDEFYDMKDNLGEGAVGCVCIAVNKSTNERRAVKQISKTSVDDKEIAAMRIMDHPNIIKLYEMYEDNRNQFLVMELCTGKDLFDHISSAQFFTEVQAAHLMMQVFRAVFYMHSLSVCHRDIKPENFLFVEDVPVERATLKLIDFGLACTFNTVEKLTTKAGTPFYVAPEVLKGSYDEKCDVWSCGVVMYVLLSGNPPFMGHDDDEDATSEKAVFQAVETGIYSYPSSEWGDVSSDAKDLIDAIFVMEPRRRPTASEALSHVWVQEKAPKAPDVTLSRNMIGNLKDFRALNKLKKAALHVIATQMDEKKIRALKDTFMSLDDNGDGLLTADELKSGLTRAGFTDIPLDLQQIMEEVDSDGSGVIDYTEFLAATIDKRHYIEEDVCWAAFRVFDTDGNGKISFKELEQVLNAEGIEQTWGNMQLEDLMRDVDTNGDGEIDFSEFMAMMRKTVGS